MVIDDLLDADIDALVERTKNRPLPRGAISRNRAWVFFGLQVVVGVCLAIKVLSSTAYVFWSRFAAISLSEGQAIYLDGCMAALYHLSHLQGIVRPHRSHAYLHSVSALDKPSSYSSRQFLLSLEVKMLTFRQGLMFKVGIFMGWSDISMDGRIPWTVLFPVYFGACLWTITYETVYQHQVCSKSLRWAFLTFLHRIRSTTSRSGSTPPLYCAVAVLFLFAPRLRWVF